MIRLVVVDLNLRKGEKTTAIGADDHDCGTIFVGDKSRLALVRLVKNFSRTLNELSPIYGRAEDAFLV